MRQDEPVFEPDVFDPERWGLPAEAVSDLSDAPAWDLEPFSGVFHNHDSRSE